MEGEVFPAGLVGNGSLSVKTGLEIAKHELLVEFFGEMVYLQSIPIAGDGLTGFTLFIKSPTKHPGVMSELATQTLPAGEAPRLVAVAREEVPTIQGNRLPDYDF